MAEYAYDVVIIGGGPGGYVAAVRASQLGLKVAVVEKDKLGGVCGNWGCIPSKALINQAEFFHAIPALQNLGVKVDASGLDYAKAYQKSREAAERSGKGVQFLMKKNKVEVISGTATLTGPHEATVDGKKVTAAYIVVATGSRPRQIPGFEFDEKTVLSSTGILSLQSLPKSLLILGSGAIGMEFAFVMSTFGVEVTVIEMLPRILPVEDPDTAAVVEKAFVKRGVKFLTATKALTLKTSATGVEVEVERAGKKETLKAEKLLVAVGRVPNTDNLGLEKLGVALDRGFVTVKDFYQTLVPSVFAIGDIVPSPLLAHVASKEGEIAVEYIASLLGKGNAPHEKKLDANLIPGATYCEPQIASFGWAEDKAKEKGIAYKAYSFPYSGNGKASAIERPEGLVKVLFDPKTHEILGAHVAGYNATEILHELLLAKKAELLPEDIATMVHAHPTISESVMEAARGVEGWAIHI
ncbi:MAG: dihydrolipoyl dehydrogenase [Spirochaetales bacterium]|nr:dihydrolipoyl dehydrogenase [Spirochaetales bacterium]